tara:strand:+ start:913 stop:1362 length:450 start_codon:yes stop_codon:yes gene_type:complete
MSRCSHVDYKWIRGEKNDIRCRERAIHLGKVNERIYWEDGQEMRGRYISDYCLEHHIQHHFTPSETLSTYCAECPEDAEPMIVMNRRLELLHSKEEGIWGDPKEGGDISSDHGFTSWGETCCPKHGGSKDQWAKYASRKSITFVRSDCR